jgi:Cu-Zn family superoxide dismutase
MRTFMRIAAPAAAAVLAAACSGTPREGASASASPSQPPVIMQASPSAAAAAPGAAAGTATAQLSPTQGSTVRGTVTFEPAGDGLRVIAHIEGLTPGEHGFHLHQNGDCSAPDGSSAGDHWNPTQQPHGAPDAPQHHAGDLGNVTADAGGVAHVDKTVQGIGLSGTESVIGHAVIVHGKPDDMKTQPSGNAGPRLACGVVSGGAAGTATGAASPAARRDPGD